MYKLFEYLMFENLYDIFHVIPEMRFKKFVKTHVLIHSKIKFL